MEFVGLFVAIIFFSLIGVGLLIPKEKKSNFTIHEFRNCAIDR